MNKTEKLKGNGRNPRQYFIANKRRRRLRFKLIKACNLFLNPFATCKYLFVGNITRLRQSFTCLLEKVIEPGQRLNEDVRSLVGELVPVWHIGFTVIVQRFIVQQPHADLIDKCRFMFVLLSRELISGYRPCFFNKNPKQQCKKTWLKSML
jgi:hypothetical protein